MSEKLRNKSWCNILKSYIVHWQPHKERIGEGFKQHNNQQIIRDKGSNKYVILFTAVAIIKCHTDPSDHQIAAPKHIMIATT